jgi:hypothetical protein
MRLKGKPFALEILEFFDVQALESHPRNRMMGYQIYYFSFES